MPVIRGLIDLEVSEWAYLSVANLNEKDIPTQGRNETERVGISFLSNISMKNIHPLRGAATKPPPPSVGISL